MSVKMVCVSHSPLMEFASPPADKNARVRGALAKVAQQIQAYQPDLIVMFGPDHFNGLFHDLMPSANVGFRAAAAGDWNMGPGEISVAEAEAIQLAQHILNDGIGIAHSYRMVADHGVTQPLFVLTGGLSNYPIIPIVLNAAAPPLAPMKYACDLGRSVGNYLQKLVAQGKKVLILGSGGLSHDPPTPQMASNPPQEVQEFLIAGRNPTPEARNARQAKVVAVGKAMSEGTGPALALDVEWDTGLMDSFKAGDLSRFEQMTDEEIIQRGGKGGHEVRCWAAAFSALATLGDYTAESIYYEPIDEWLVGFGIMSAELKMP